MVFFKLNVTNYMQVNHSQKGCEVVGVSSSMLQGYKKFNFIIRMYLISVISVTCIRTDSWKQRFVHPLL